MWTSSGQHPTGTPSSEESGPLAENTHLTGSEPSILDDFHYSQTTEIFFQEQSSDAVLLYLFDTEQRRDHRQNALFTPVHSEREEPADRRQAYHSFKESLLPSQSLSVCHARTGRPVHELSSLSSRSREKPSAPRFSLNDKKSKFSLILRQKFTKQFQTDSDRRSI